MERTVVVRIIEGLHARPAALFVQEAGRQPASVQMSRAGADPVEAASILGVMTIGASVGDTVVLRTQADDDDARVSLDALEAFLSQETVA